MNEKHREVHCWLEKVFGGDTVPPYEINPKTVDLLFSLKQQNEKQDKAAEIIIEDLQQKTEEYTAEADRIGGVLNRLGLSSDTLSQSGATSLKTLSNVANILDVRDTSDTSLLLGLSETSRNSMRMEECRISEQKLCTHLFNKTKSALQRLNHLQKALQTIEDEVRHQGPDLEKKAKQAAYLQSKSKEYKKQIQQHQLELTNTGADPLIYHQTLVKRAEELEELRKTLQPLRAKMDSYRTLPPDLSLAKVKVEEAKLELAKLEEELTKHIDMMHV